ncbi:MAG: SgcJ/EcaC family oxidoreductase [Acidobacteria bacterium]|nr:SgcJ/EcaC family oxidoreductase [Acidobacteriota bacterium]
MHLILMTLLALPLSTNPINPGSSHDEKAIRELITRYVDAREKTDPAAVEALFTPDADQLVSSGEWRRGRASLVAGATASSRRSPGHRSISIDNIRFLSPGIAIVDGRYELTGQNGAPPRKMWSTLIVQRSKAGWKIAAIRNMLPAPPAETR